MSEVELGSEKSINKKNSKDFFIINDNPNYILNLYSLIYRINTTIENLSQQKNIEYTLNILLTSSKLNDQNKLACLLLLFYLYQKSERNQVILIPLFFKICKLCKKLEIFNEELVQKNISITEDPNFVITLEYIAEIKKVFTSEKKLDKNFKTLIDSLERSANEKLNLYLEENISKFSGFNLITDEQLDKIKEIIVQLFSNNYHIKETSSPLYLIDKLWIYKLKAFIEPYIESRKEKVVNLLCEGAFIRKRVLEFIQMKNDNFNPLENFTGVVFPGPINNFNLIDKKNFWYDPVNEEENDIIKNNLKINEHYFLLNQDDWYLLKSIFKDTNELKRKKFDDDIFKFNTYIIEPRLAKEENNILLKKKYVQININGNVKELKNKIIRCLNYALDGNVKKNKEYYDNLCDNNDVDFYVINKKNKELLIELFFSLVNNNKIYESLYFKKINFENDNSSIKDIFNTFDVNTQILVSEIIPKNNYNFIKPIIGEGKRGRIFYCSVCGEQINLKEKYNCNLCNFSLFCSYECAKLSAEHINLHEALKKFYIRNFDLKNFLSENIDLYKESPKDVMTFNKDKNNNYSAINSVIHCLANTTDLTKYFLSKKFLNDLNINDYLLNKNTFSQFFYHLLNKMWNNEGNQKLEVYHQNILNFLLKKIDCDPNDKSNLTNVREIISLILTIFDKEINRSHNMYNITAQDWRNKSKERSIITDLFKGIHQTNLSCAKCGNVSIIYDFFSILLLPIPKKHSNITLKYFSETDYKTMNYTYDESSDIKELKDKAMSFLSEKINKIVQMMSLTDLIEVTAFDTDDEKILTEITMYNSLELVQIDKNKIITKVYSTDKVDDSNSNNNNSGEESDLKMQIKNIYKDNDIELVFYERDVFEEPCINIYVYPFPYYENDKSSFNKDKFFHVYPIAIPSNLSLILENFEYYLNTKLRKLLLDNYAQESEKTGTNYIELVYPHYSSNFLLYSSTSCFLCKEKARNNLFCPLFDSIDKNLTIKDLMQKFEYPKQPIILLAKSQHYDTSKKYYLNINCFFNKKENKKQFENKIDIINCFQLHLKKEILEGIDWFCEACNSYQICEKQLSIYYLPIYLIIQIDRFAIKKSNVKSNIDNSVISIPINNLDLSKFVEGPEKNKYKYNYNLYAIIYKDISSRNDFTYCTCKNSNKWFLFKDNKVQIASELINKYVHFLFYKRVDAQQ